MIEWWDKRIQDNPQLVTLKPAQLRLFAVASADHSFATVYDDLKKSIDTSHVALIQSALDFCWRHRQKDRAPARTIRLRTQISELFQDTEEEGYNHVWNHIVGAVASALDALVGNNLLQDVLTAACDAYEAVRWMVFNEACESGRYRPPRVRGGPRDRHMREYAERFYLSQPLCFEELTFQEDCIERLTVGKVIKRSQQGSKKGRE